ncbi:hypothetical protein Bca52824_050085 [Brassica carinata]|uniref:Myb-like domain-containing protein n=1 Tax=Brassica carinata TaxID=52824 RepID=A0A8X7UVV8_BRACI|nr:hypothetical protein Bca52824_050085 [Brassica carinata]
MGGTDAKDILGLPRKTPLSLTQEKKSRHRKPDGISRESVDVLKYTDDEYENHLTDPVWTKEETDPLFELCERFDLRFTVIADRFPLSRTLEELKDRYYSGFVRTYED